MLKILMPNQAKVANISRFCLKKLFAHVNGVFRFYRQLQFDIQESMHN